MEEILKKFEKEEKETEKKNRKKLSSLQMMQFYFRRIFILKRNIFKFKAVENEQNEIKVFLLKFF